MKTLQALFASRKVWIGTMTVLAVIVAAVLVTIGKLPSSEFVPTITAITAIGLGVVGSVAWEDAASKGAGGSAAPPPAPAVENATTVNVSSAPAEGEPKVG